MSKEPQSAVTMYDIIRYNELTQKWKHLSWAIFELARNYDREDISGSKFREEVRELLEQHTTGPNNQDVP